jgi:hypothetical protein
MGVVMPSLIIVSAIMLSGIILSFQMPNVLYSEGHCGLCSYAECHYTECNYSECRHFKCHYCECHYSEYHNRVIIVGVILMSL